MLHITRITHEEHGVDISSELARHRPGGTFSAAKNQRKNCFPNPDEKHVESNRCKKKRFRLFNKFPWFKIF